MIDFPQTQLTTITDQVLLDKSDSSNQEGSGFYNFDTSFDSTIMNPPITWQHSVQMSLFGASNGAPTSRDSIYGNNTTLNSGLGYAYPPQDSERSSIAESTASFSDHQSAFDHASPNEFDNFDSFSSAMPVSNSIAPMPTAQRTQTESVWQRRLQSRAKQAQIMDLRRSTSDINGSTSQDPMYPVDPQGTDAALAFQQFPAPFGIPGQQHQQDSVPPPPPPFQDNEGTYTMPQIDQITDFSSVNNNENGDASIKSSRHSPYDLNLQSTKNNSKSRRRIRGGIGKSTTIEKVNELKKSSSSKGVINKVVIRVHADTSSSDAIDLRTGEAGLMRHMCPHEGCNKHFSTSGHARRHSRIHDSLRPFVCPHENCNATFTRRDNCTQHQRARHQFQLIAHRIGSTERR